MQAASQEPDGRTGDGVITQNVYTTVADAYAVKNAATMAVSAAQANAYRVRG